MNKITIKKTSYMGLLLSLSVALAVLEGTLPSFSSVPGIKIGISNVVTMYALFFMGIPCAVILALIKSIFVLLTRGAVAGLLSVVGGLCSVLMMAFVRRLRSSETMTSIVGAVMHNVAQLFIAWFFVKSNFVLYYLPILIATGIGMGFVTSLILRLALPALEKLNINYISDKRN